MIWFEKVSFKGIFKELKSNDGLQLSIGIRIGKFRVRLITLYQSHYQFCDLDSNLNLQIAIYHFIRIWENCQHYFVIRIGKNHYLY